MDSAIIWSAFNIMKRIQSVNGEWNNVANFRIQLNFTELAVKYAPELMPKLPLKYRNMGIPS